MGTEPVAVALTPAGILAAVVAFLSAFNIWTPPPDQFNALLGLITLLVAGGVALARGKVTPVK